LAWQHIAKRGDFASAISCLYQTCSSLRQGLSDEGFHMRTFSLCRVLADGNGAQTFDWVQATIARQIERLSYQADQAWWKDARSLVQRCGSRAGSGNVWRWLQMASQEPHTGLLSLRAAATAKFFVQPLVHWPSEPQVRFPGQCTLRGHSGPVTQVQFSDDGLQAISGSRDVTVFPDYPRAMSQAPQDHPESSWRNHPTGVLLGRGLRPASAEDFGGQVRVCRGRKRQAPDGPTHPRSEWRYTADLRKRRGGR